MISFRLTTMQPLSIIATSQGCHIVLQNHIALMHAQSTLHQADSYATSVKDLNPQSYHCC